MCEYCECKSAITFNKDEYLVGKKIFKVKTFWRRDSPSGDISMYISDKGYFVLYEKLEKYLSEVKINFCPFCGENLEKGKRNEIRLLKKYKCNNCKHDYIKDNTHSNFCPDCGINNKCYDSLDTYDECCELCKENTVYNAIQRGNSIDSVKCSGIIYVNYKYESRIFTVGISKQRRSLRWYHKVYSSYNHFPSLLREEIGDASIKYCPFCGILI